MSTNHENEFLEQLGGYDEPTSINIQRPVVDPQQYSPPSTQQGNGAHSAVTEDTSTDGSEGRESRPGPTAPQHSLGQDVPGRDARDDGPDTGPIAVARPESAHRAPPPPAVGVLDPGGAPASPRPPRRVAEAPGQFPQGGYQPHAQAHYPQYGQAAPQPPTWQAAPTPTPAHNSAPAGTAVVARSQRSANDLHRARKRPSKRGWRKWLYKASFETINVGESRDEIEVRLLTTAIKAPLSGPHSIVVTGGKGGCGKTVVTSAVATVFAQIRKKDPVLAADADPAQAANLPDRIAPEASSTFADVLAEQEIKRNSELRNYTGQNLETGLDVLAGPARVGGHTDLDAATYTDAHVRLQKLYNLLFTDTGVDFRHQVMKAVLDGADSLIMVASAIPDGLAGANIALEWLEAAGYKRLEPNMVIVINHIRAFDGRKDRKRTLRQVEEMKAEFVKRVPEDRIFELPYDPHIAEAGVLEFELLAPRTRRVLMKIAAATASGFGTAAGGSR